MGVFLAFPLISTMAKQNLHPSRLPDFKGFKRARPSVIINNSVVFWKVDYEREGKRNCTIIDSFLLLIAIRHIDHAWVVQTLDKAIHRTRREERETGAPFLFGSNFCVIVTYIMQERLYQHTSFF